MIYLLLKMFLQSKKKKENQSSQPSPLLHSTRKINDKLPDSPKDSKAVISTLSATDNHYDTTSAPAEATQVASPNQIQFYSSLSSDEKSKTFNSLRRQFIMAQWSKTKKKTLISYFILISH